MQCKGDWLSEQNLKGYSQEGGVATERCVPQKKKN